MRFFPSTCSQSIQLFQLSEKLHLEKLKYVSQSFSSHLIPSYDVPLWVLIEQIINITPYHHQLS